MVDKTKNTPKTKTTSEKKKNSKSPLMIRPQDLKPRLEKEFKPLGIVAYSGCCHWGCTGSYDEEDSDFEARENGIYYVCLYLEGMNFEPDCFSCVAYYFGEGYLSKHWEEEKSLLDKFCSVIGLKNGEYKIEKPLNDDEGIVIEFLRPLMFVN